MTQIMVRDFNPFRHVISLSLLFNEKRISQFFTAENFIKISENNSLKLVQAYYIKHVFTIFHSICGYVMYCCNKIDQNYQTKNDTRKIIVLWSLYLYFYLPHNKESSPYCIILISCITIIFSEMMFVK